MVIILNLFSSINTSRVDLIRCYSCHSDKFEASKILLAMGVDESIAGNAIRMSVGRETTRQQIETVIQDLKQALKKISLE